MTMSGYSLLVCLGLQRDLDCPNNLVAPAIYVVVINGMLGIFLGLKLSVFNSHILQQNLVARGDPWAQADPQAKELDQAGH